jgi:hypothetical protein
MRQRRQIIIIISVRQAKLQLRESETAEIKFQEVAVFELQLRERESEEILTVEVRHHK